MAVTWTVGRKLFTGVGALALLAVLGGAVAWWQLAALKQALDTAARRDARKLELVLQMEQRMTSVRTAERGLILGALAGDQGVATEAREGLARDLADARRLIGDIEPLVGTAEASRAVTELRRILDEWQKVQADLEAHIAAAEVTEAWNLSQQRSSPLLVRAAREARDLVRMQQQFLEEAVAAGEATYAAGATVLLGAMGLSVFVALVVAWRVRDIITTLRETAGELGEGAEQVSSAAGQVATASQSLSHGATEQAASLEQTSASMEEMASMTRRNAENSHHAATLMQNVDGRVQESNRALDEMVASMAAIKDSSSKISKIIKTIDEIAFQTNILALNAAVEAARAGEAGMGFAVVADEVRSLAQRSAQAAHDTAALIEESIAKSTEGAGCVQQVAGTIRGITDAVTEAKGLVEDVSVASRQQAQGIDQVTQAIAQMEKVTQSTAATAEESAAASEELSAQAETAMTLVRRLQGMVGAVALPRLQAADEAPVDREARPVLRMAVRPRAAAPRSPEDEIPLEDTGTFGRF